MTFSSIDEIKSLIKDPINKDMLERAQEIRAKHELHVSGIGLDSYLDKIQGIENDNAVSLRRALGGGRFYDFSNDRDKNNFISKILANVKNEMSMRTYMQKVWRELVNTDPNGLIMGEITTDGQNVNLTYKSSDSIHDIAYRGAQKIEYIIFKPEIDKDSVKFYRVIDDSFDYLIKVDYSLENFT